MTWEHYYQTFYDWSTTTQLNRISSIADFPSMDELLEIVENLDEKGASKLINKALSKGVYFSADNIILVCEYLNKETTTTLIKQCKDRFTPQQIEHITDYTVLWEDEILKLLAYDMPSLLEDDEMEDDFEIEPPFVAPKQKKLGMVDKVALGVFGAHILDELFGTDGT